MPDSNGSKPTPPAVVEFRLASLSAVVETFIESLRNDGRHPHLADALESQYLEAIGERDRSPVTDPLPVTPRTRRRWDDLTGTLVDVTVRGRIDHVEIVDVPPPKEDC